MTDPAIPVTAATDDECIPQPLNIPTGTLRKIVAGNRAALGLSPQCPRCWLTLDDHYAFEDGRAGCDHPMSCDCPGFDAAGGTAAAAGTNGQHDECAQVVTAPNVRDNRCPCWVLGPRGWWHSMDPCPCTCHYPHQPAAVPGRSAADGENLAAALKRELAERIAATRSPAGTGDVSRDAEVLHAEHHPGTFVPSLDSCTVHERADYEQRIRDMNSRSAADAGGAA